MKIGSINFPDRLIKDIRTEKLVNFAGASVSMGDPANLPSFNVLAEKIATGRLESWPKQEPADKFLGRLQKLGVQVHERALVVLKLEPGSYTPLHSNLLRLFPSVDFC